jgi:hypothetical protein
MADPNPYQSPESAFPAINVSNPPPQSAPAKGAKFQSLGMITRMLQGIYLVLLGISLFTGAICFQSRSMLAEIDGLERKLRSAGRDPYIQAKAQKHDSLVGKFKENMALMQIIGGPVVQLISGVLLIAFAGWVYKASCNLRVLQAEGATGSPGLAALGVFLPVVNLIVSLPILNAIAKGSDPDRWSPYGTNQRGMSLLVLSWWMLNLLSIVGAAYVLLAVIPHAKTRPEVLSMLGIQGTLMFFCALPLAVAWWMFGTIHSNQEKRLWLVENPPERPQVKVTPEFLGADIKID